MLIVLTYLEPPRLVEPRLDHQPEPAGCRGERRAPDDDLGQGRMRDVRDDRLEDRPELVVVSLPMPAQEQRGDQERQLGDRQQPVRGPAGPVGYGLGGQVVPGAALGVVAEVGRAFVWRPERRYPDVCRLNRRRPRPCPKGLAAAADTPVPPSGAALTPAGGSPAAAARFWMRPVVGSRGRAAMVALARSDRALLFTVDFGAAIGSSWWC
jgi:hypothetical protein